MATSHCTPPKAAALVEPPPPNTSGAFSSQSHSALRDRYAVIVIVDGGRMAEIKRLVDAGRLPTVKRLFYDNGAVFTHATSTAPTLSMPGHQAIMTGLYPGNHGIPDLTWYDRANGTDIDYLSLGGPKRVNSDLINRRLFYAASDVFSDVPHTLFNALRGQEGFVSYEFIYDGASVVHPKRLIKPVWKALAEKRYEYLDIDAMQAAIDAWRTHPVFPRLTAIACYSIDDLSHEFTPDSDRVRMAYEGIDRGLRTLEETAAARGVLDRMTWVLTADHGQHPTQGKEVKLSTVFELLGFKASENKRFADDVIHIKARNVGDAQIYLKLGANWRDAPSYAELTALALPRSPELTLLSALRRSEGVGFIAIRKDFHTLHLFDQDSDALIRGLEYGNTKLLSYTPLSSTNDNDPLGYTGEPSMHGKWTPGRFYDARAWAEMSRDARRPDAVVALSQLFESPDAPDIFLITRPEYTIGESKPSNHGSLERDDMQVPLLLSGPDIRKGHYVVARIVDIYPTLLSVFGIAEDPALYDGERLDEALSISGSPDTPRIAVLPALAELEAFFADHPDYSRVIDKDGFHRDLAASVGPYPAADTRGLLEKETARLAHALKRIDTWQPAVKAKSPAQKFAVAKQRRLLRLMDWERAKIQARLTRLYEIEIYLKDRE